MPDPKPQTRHVDKGVLLGTFAKESLVVCPKCKGPALVTCESRYTIPFIPLTPRVCCLKCSFQKAGDEFSWCGAVNGLAQERCPHCGYKWLQQTFESKSFSNRARKSTPITCPSCQQTSKVEIRWHIDRIGKPQDPAFGLPLWLRAPCYGDTLWAYNASHLQSLRDYVSATLREKTGVRQYSMFVRLPKWMSAHKNRDAVLACIDRLQKTLPPSRT